MMEPKEEKNTEEKPVEEQAAPVEEAEDATTTAEQSTETIENRLTTLEQELSAAQDQCKEFSEGWQRERADFMNYRKRMEREQELLHQTITGNIIKKYLSVMDDMERALANRPPDADTQDWWEGIELIYRKLKNILESEGVQPIPAEGELFNPAIHEAISHEDCDGFESGRVIAVVQQGYRIGDRVIRPALVRVAR
jgi:molecular chaperone GrpE